MAKIRVYELARDLNMKNKALLNKLSEMNISVRSHMSSLEDDTVAQIKSNILGKNNDVCEVKRVRPNVIRRRRKVSFPTTETQPDQVCVEESNVEEDAAVSAEAVQKTIEKTETPAETEEQPSVSESKAETEAAAVIVKPAPVKKVSVPEPETKEAEAPVAEAPAPETAPDSEAETEAPEETVEKVPETSEEPSVVVKPPEKKADESQEEKTVAEQPEPVKPEKKAKKKTAKKEKPAPKASKPERQPKTPHEKPAKAKADKERKKKKETPAKIIKLADKTAAIALKKKAAEQVQTGRTKKKLEAPYTAPPEEKSEIPPADTDTEAGRLKKKGKWTKRPEDIGKDKKFVKKKSSFRKREVIEGADLYTGDKRSRKGKHAAKSKAAQGMKTQITTPKAIKRRIKIDDAIILSDLAKRMGIKASEMIAKLMTLGVMATVNQTIDYDTAALVASEFNYEIEKAAFEEETFLTVEKDDPAKLEKRPPVVTIMGHVDHGKTSLLDVIRKTRITEMEAGGITQHIGAYNVSTKKGQIVFLDTPGHEAFTAMRARGAKVTDIVVLVVAADDGVMPQTIEAINHAKAAEVPIIAAVNKIDKAGADPDRVMRELAESGLTPEDWGGDTIFCNVSAKQNTGIDELLEMILLQSEMLELKANPDKLAIGHVVEAKLDSGRGAVATVLVKEGTLRKGDPVVCGIHYGKIRAMLNDIGQQVQEAGPSMPVGIIGLSGVPMAGDEMIAVSDEKNAKQVSMHRIQKQRSKDLAKTNRLSLEGLFEKLKDENIKDLNIIIKADVDGSIEALKDSLVKLSNEEVKINAIHAATGTITESDISLATVSDAIIIGFNVRPNMKVQELASEENVDIRYHNIIYNVIKEMKDAIVGLMESTYEERTIGHADVRAVFQVPKIGAIAGSYVTNGKIERGKNIRLLRDGIIQYEGKISSLRRFKDDVKEVQSGYECGIGIEKYNDLKVGDTIECYYFEEIKPQLD